MVELLEPLDTEGHLGLELHRPFELSAHRGHVAIDEGFAFALKINYSKIISEKMYTKIIGKIGFVAKGAFNPRG